MVHSSQYIGFDSWPTLLAYVGEHQGSVFYQAPLDYRPQRVTAKRKGKRVWVEPWTTEADPFLVGEKHLERFLRLVD